MFWNVSRMALAACLGLAVVGCKNSSSPDDATKKSPSNAPATGPGSISEVPDINRPGINATPNTPSGLDKKNPPTVTEAAPAPGEVPAKVVPATQAANGVTPPAEAGVNPLFTLPPSKGPAPHKFQQLTLDRSGPSGTLEMQLTGDGIYRVRDHGRGNSYAGDGKLTDAQIEEWANAMKGWESLKDDYRADPKSKDGDTVEIFYGGKRVVINTAGTDNPKIVTDAYKRLLDLNEQSKKEAAAAEAAVPTATPEKKDSEKKE